MKPAPFDYHAPKTVEEAVALLAELAPEDGRVLAGMNVNTWGVTDAIEALVRSGARVDPAELADPDHHGYGIMEAGAKELLERAGHSAEAGASQPAG